MSDDVFLKFEYDERDIWNGVRLRLAGRLRGAWLLVLGSAVASAVVVSLAPTWGRVAAGGLATLSVAAIALVAVRVAPPKMFRAPPVQRRVEPTRRAPEPEGFRDATMSIDASDDGIAVTVGARLATIRWDECERLQADPRCYVLHFGSGGFVVVPRRRFRNERRDSAFRELVETCMDRSADLDRVAEDADGSDALPADEEPHALREDADAPALAAASPASPTATAESTPKVGRNEPCPCGSGKKYKKCCLAADGVG